MNKKEKYLNIIYHSYLISALILLTIFNIYFNNNLYFSESILALTLIQCYFMFHNVGKMVGVFSLTNSSLNGFVNFTNRMYTSFVYSLYGASVGLFLIINGKNEQNKLNIKKSLIKISVILITGFIFFWIMNYQRQFSILLLFDLIIFSGNMCGGFLASKQSFWQFVVFIPIGIIQIITGIILHEPIFILTSIIYLFSDVLSIYKWLLVAKQQI